MEIVLGWLCQLRLCVLPGHRSSLVGDFKSIRVESMQCQGYNIVAFAAALLTEGLLLVRRCHQRPGIEPLWGGHTGTRALGLFLLPMLERTSGSDSIKSTRAGEGLPRSHKSDWSVSHSSVHPDDCCLLSLPSVSLGQFITAELHPPNLLRKCEMRRPGGSDSEAAMVTIRRIFFIDDGSFSL